MTPPNSAAKGGAKQDAAEAAKQQPSNSAPAASSQPREYTVFREFKAEDVLKVEQFDGATVLVELGKAQAKTPKEARRTVAKEKLSQDELTSENGVALRAITTAAATAGRGVAKLKVEPSWDD